MQKTETERYILRRLPLEQTPLRGSSGLPKQSESYSPAFWTPTSCLYSRLGNNPQFIYRETIVLGSVHSVPRGRKKGEQVGGPRFELGFLHPAWEIISTYSRQSKDETKRHCQTGRGDEVGTGQDVVLLCIIMTYVPPFGIRVHLPVGMKMQVINI